MQILGNTLKSTNIYGKTIAIALILVLSLSSALMIMPTIKAQPAIQNSLTLSPYNYTPTYGDNGLLNVPTFAGVTVAPDPVGVGQPVAVIMIIELLPPSQGSEAATGTTGGWLGYTLTIKDPNGNTTSLGPFESDVSGTYQVTYTPTVVGNYTFTFNFPGQTNKGSGYGAYFANFLPSTATDTLLVQQAQLTPFQEAPVPLPNQYWSQPINGQNRFWNVISGPWLDTWFNATGTYNPYTYPVMSPHVLWAQETQPLQYGLAGGTYGSIPFGGTSGVTGSGYPQVGFNSKGNEIIMGGYMYWDNSEQVVQGLTQTISGTTNAQVALTPPVNQIINTIVCTNLQTGQQVWQVPGGPIQYGQILAWRSQQQRMTLGYLWMMNAGNWQMYDATNGQLLAQWLNQPAGTLTQGTGINATRTNARLGEGPIALTEAVSVPSPAITFGAPAGASVVQQPPSSTVIGQDIGGAGGGGAILVYLSGHNTGSNVSWLACWNSTLAINSYNGDPTVWNFLSPGDFPSIQSQITTPLDWEDGIMWNYTLPQFNTISASGATVPTYPSMVGADSNYVLLQTGKSSPNATTTEEYFDLIGVQISSCAYLDGTDLPMPPVVANYNKAITPAWVTQVTIPDYDQTFPGQAHLTSDGNIIITDTNVLAVWDYSLSTGLLKWTCNPYQNDFSLQSTSPGTVAWGMLYQQGYDGYMHAINTTTGVQQWVSITQPGGLEMPEPGYPASASIVAGQTMANGVVYTSTTKSYETQPAYRGHTLFAYNTATGKQIWNISGEYTAMEIADGILIGFNGYDGREYAFGPGPSATTVTAPMTTVTTGTPMIIQGTVTDQTPGIAMGTPVVSDQWMGQWEEYLYMEQPLPTQATGVNIVITAIDPNHNYVTIGNATSDLSGAFSYQWTPPSVPGKYTIIATFNADNSYYGSCGETAVTVGSAPAATTAPTATPTSVADMYFVPAIAGLFVLIIIVAIVLALLMLRKRP